VSNPKILRRLIPFVLLLAGLSLACETPSRVDDHFGEAYRASKQRMIANADAGKEPDDGINDLEGVTVEGILKRYRREQTQPQNKSVPTSILVEGMPTSN
jgi:hypothetical protein